MTKLEASHLEELVRTILDSHEAGWNKQNDKYELSYSLTLTHHKVPFENLEQQGIASDKVNTDVAYLRLHRHIKPKGADDSETDTMLLHHGAYRFRNLQERLDPKGPWKLIMYIDLLGKLVAAGVEYSELMWRLKNQIKMEKEAKPEPAPAENKLDLVITDQMPQDQPGDAEYRDWVKRNRDAT